MIVLSVVVPMKLFGFGVNRLVIQSDNCTGRNVVIVYPLRLNLLDLRSNTTNAFTVLIYEAFIYLNRNN